MLPRRLPADATELMATQRLDEMIWGRSMANPIPTMTQWPEDVPSYRADDVEFSQEDHRSYDDHPYSE